MITATIVQWCASCVTGNQLAGGLGILTGASGVLGALGAAAGPAGPAGAGGWDPGPLQSFTPSPPDAGPGTAYPGATHELGPVGSSTTYSPDGTTTSVDPNGGATSGGTSGDGTSFTYGPGGEQTNAPDGTVTTTTYGPGGSTTTVDGPGGSSTVGPSGDSPGTPARDPVQLPPPPPPPRPLDLTGGADDPSGGAMPAWPTAPTAPAQIGPEPIADVPPPGVGPQPLTMPTPVQVGPTPLVDVPEPTPPPPPPPPSPGLTAMPMTSGTTPLVSPPDDPGHLNAGPPLTGGAHPMPGPGGTTITSADGQIVVTAPDGTQVTAVQTGGGGYQAGLSDGNLLTVKPDGSASIQLPDGSTQNWDAHGRYTGTQPPSNTYAQQGANANPSNPTHDVQVPMTGGGFRIDHPDGSSDIHWPDGSIVHVAPDQQHWYQVRGAGSGPQ